MAGYFMSFSDLKFELPVIWRIRDLDIPVTIVGFLGFENGEYWFLIESKEGEVTGAPASQLFVGNQPLSLSFAGNKC